MSDDLYEQYAQRFQHLQTLDDAEQLATDARGNETASKLAIGALGAEISKQSKYGDNAMSRIAYACGLATRTVHERAAVVLFYGGYRACAHFCTSMQIGYSHLRTAQRHGVKHGEDEADALRIALHALQAAADGQMTIEAMQDALRDSDAPAKPVAVFDAECTIETRMSNDLSGVGALLVHVQGVDVSQVESGQNYRVVIYPVEVESDAS